LGGIELDLSRIIYIDKVRTNYDEKFRFYLKLEDAHELNLSSLNEGEVITARANLVNAWRNHCDQEPIEVAKKELPTISENKQEGTSLEQVELP